MYGVAVGLKDWWQQVTGSAAEPEPAFTPPKPPGDEEILASLQRVHVMLDDGKASPLVRSRAARIDRLIREILPRLPQLGLGSVDAYSVMATATNYLPESVEGYLRLPRDWADTRPIDGGRTALMVLIDQLELLAATMDKMLDAAIRADAEALIAHGRFLDTKFGGPGPSAPGPVPGLDADGTTFGPAPSSGGTAATPPSTPPNSLDLGS